ncbi:hypothetical protein AQUSIP_15780 [Aquicella siphonis]|uniref:Uncharacterized protein n=1 Tax=Aquicella siphonis TaxID=254247 RepID=A0A5E4PH17_9COXI|nr:hypothetical protein [Aquicella siphonis]VVC76269.1 hypothetical protein AQUSIP_15780 [Aquicella siphonis]
MQSRSQLNGVLSASSGGAPVEIILPEHVLAARSLFPRAMAADSQESGKFAHQLGGTLEALKKFIQQHEREKYPDPPYQYFNGYRVINGIPQQVICVSYKGEPLQDKELTRIREHSVIVRKLNILAGVLFAMQFSSSFYKQDIGIAERLHKILADRIASAMEPYSGKDKSPRAELDDFAGLLARDISAVTGESSDEVIRKIRNAERYFVADNNRQRVFAFETVFEGEASIWQVDIPYGNKLSDAQRLEYQKIHLKKPADRPAWFNLLADWEQEWLLQVIPDPEGRNNQLVRWDYFESLFQSSAMQHIPGIKNIRTNYLVKAADDHCDVISSSIKTSTMVPYEMPDVSRDENVRLTAEQMLDEMQSHAVASLSRFRQLFPQLSSTFKPVLLAQSLLSDVKVAKADIRLANAQRDAVRELSGESKYQDVRIISGNDPVNILRVASHQDSGRWEYAKEIMQTADDFIGQIKPGLRRLNPEQRARYDLITDAHEKLSQLYSIGFMRRTVSNLKDVNYEAFKVAYLGVLVEAMGGVVSTNCKSGKDRTGLEEIYRNAMWIYFEKYNKLPGFNDKGADRKNFIEIFVKLFNTMKAHETAANNTPGSFGLKDDAQMLCKDIARALGKSYQESNDRAAMNKPKKFTSDEERQGETRNIRITPQDEGWDGYVRNLNQSALQVYIHIDRLIMDEASRAFVRQKIHDIVEYGLTLTNPSPDASDVLRRTYVLKIITQLEQCDTIENMMKYLSETRLKMQKDAEILRRDLNLSGSGIRPKKSSPARAKTRSTDKLDKVMEDLVSGLDKASRLPVQTPVQKTHPSPLVSHSIMSPHYDSSRVVQDREGIHPASQYLDFAVHRVEQATRRLGEEIPAERSTAEGMDLLSNTSFFQPAEPASEVRDQSRVSHQADLEITPVRTQTEILTNMVFVLDHLVNTLSQIEMELNKTSSMLKTFNQYSKPVSISPVMFSSPGEKKDRDSTAHVVTPKPIKSGGETQ